MRNQFECYQILVLKDDNGDSEVVTMVHIYKDHREAIDFTHSANIHLFSTAKADRYEYIDGPYQSGPGM